MKKYFSVSAIALLALLQSCKEKGVLIDMGDRRDIYDTTYVAAVEAAQPHTVLIEEFTGASCTNCPQGHALVASILGSNPERVVAVAYHTFTGGKIFQPVKKPGEVSQYDFRDSVATEISVGIYGGLNSIPKGGIDRITIGTSRQLDKENWSLQVSNRLAVASPVNMYLTSSYDETENKVRIKVKIAYTKAVSFKNSLTIGVIENDIIDAQEFPDSVDMHYNHSHVFRKCLTSPYYGSSVLDSIATKEPGRVYEYNYSFTPPDAGPGGKWNLNNCKIVAFLSNSDSDNKEVIQAKEVKLK